MQIKDIAKIAGVGVGTVSRVINNCPDVSEKTRRKVSKIIEKYNYKKHFLNLEKMLLSTIWWL